MKKEAKLRRWLDWLKGPKQQKNDPTLVDVFVNYPRSYNTFHQVAVLTSSKDK